MSFLLYISEMFTRCLSSYYTPLFFVVHHQAHKEVGKLNKLQPSTDDTSNNLPLSKHGFLVQVNLNNKGHIYGFGVEGLVMKQ